MSNSEYKKGAEDLREAIRFIFSASQQELEEAYGKGATTATVSVDLEPEEIISKYRDYMQRIGGPIEVGNGVWLKKDEHRCEPLIVTGTGDTFGKPTVTCLTKRGAFYIACLEDVVKTGRDFPQIREALDILNGKAEKMDKATRKTWLKEFTHAAFAAANNPVRLGRYRHYKAGLYEVIANGYLEETGEAAVIYKSETTGTVWVRTWESWSETVETCDSNMIYSEEPRFKFIGDDDEKN